MDFWRGQTDRQTNKQANNGHCNLQTESASDRLTPVALFEVPFGKKVRQSPEIFSLERRIFGGQISSNEQKITSNRVLFWHCNQ